MNCAALDMAAACRRAVEDQRARGFGPFAQRYHLMPCTGFLNDPNGLCQVGGTYHAYYQCSPLNVEGGLKFWGHAQSRDLVSWEDRGVVLFPDSRLDCHGVYSGSALPTPDGIVCAYTGNVREEELGSDHDFVRSGRQQTTLLVTTPDGQRFLGKRVALTNADYPADVTCHVRDPKLYATEGLSLEGPQVPAYVMVLGARRRGPSPEQDAGELLVYGSDDLRHWHLQSRIGTPEPFGYMWECPDYLELRGQDGSLVRLVAFCPQGLDGPEWEGRNTYQSGWALLHGDLLGAPEPEGRPGDAAQAGGSSADAPELGDFHLWDYGFDFYAPQTFVDEKGRRILIGWMGSADTPDEKNLTLEDGWQHCFTVPREVTVDTSGPAPRVLCRPVAEVAGRRRDHVQGDGRLRLEGEPCFDLEVTDVGDACSVRLGGGLELAWEPGRGQLALRFDQGAAGAIGGGRRERTAPVQGLRNLRVLGDASSVEVFANDGEVAFSTRYYPDRYAVEVEAPGAHVDAWRLEVAEPAEGPQA